MTDYLELIKENYEEFTKSEKRVADFVVSSGTKLISSTLQDIKKATSVGDATIIRFCQKLGFSGFSELKIAIAEKGYQMPNSDASFAKVVEEKLIDSIKQTYSLTKIDSLEQAAQLIHYSQQVFIFGVGSSGLSALDMESRLLRSGIRSKAIIDPHYQAMNASLFNEKDVVIAFSLTGRTKDLVDSLTVAKQNGAKIVVISNYLLSPIAQLGDVVIQTAIEEYLLNGGSLSGKVSQIYAMDVLITCYEVMYGINNVDMRKKIAKAIVDKQVD